jgi:hypothetical protein
MSTNNHNDGLGIPDFLRVKNRVPLTAEQTARLKTVLQEARPVERAGNLDRPRTWSAEAEAILTEQENQKRKKTTERIAALRRSKGLD